MFKFISKVECNNSSCAMGRETISKSRASLKSQMSRNNNRIIALILFAMLSFSSYGQEKIDTIYYDKDWKGVTNRAFADFYRIAVYPDNNLYKKQFRDYYITGELQASGGFISIDEIDDSKSIFDGECINYFKNGKVASRKTVRNGKINGEFCEYSEDGLFKRKGTFAEDELSGLYTEFLEDGSYIQAEYLAGKPKYDYYVMSNQSGFLLKIRFSDNQPIWESPAVSERKTEYRKGTAWQYYIKNGLTVAQTNTTVKDYGKWHRIDLIISNNSMIPIEFDPELITAFSVDKKEKQIDLAVWSSERYMKKVKRSQTWAAIGMGLAEGLATMNAGYSTSTTNSSAYYSGTSNRYGNVSAYGSGGYAYGSYSGNSTYSGSAYGTSTTNTYDATAAYQARVLSAQRMADFDNAQWQERQSKDEGYLKKTTIYPGETITGYVHIERKTGKSVYITVDINGAKYLYGWNYGK